MHRTVMIPTTLHRIAKMEAAKRGVGLYTLIERAIEDYLGEEVIAEGMRQIQKHMEEQEPKEVSNACAENKPPLG